MIEGGLYEFIALEFNGSFESEWLEFPQGVKDKDILICSDILYKQKI